jgi:hypothetical protein
MLGIERTKSLRLTWLVLALLLLLLAGACLHIHQMRQHGFFDQWFEWSLGDWGVRINYGCETSRGTSRDLFLTQTSFGWGFISGTSSAKVSGITDSYSARMA